MSSKTKSERLSIDQCRAILEEDGQSYSDEQIIALRDLLYQLAEIEYNQFKEWVKKKDNEI